MPQIILRIEFEEMDYEQLTAPSQTAKSERQNFETALRQQLSSVLDVGEEQLRITDIVPGLVQIEILLLPGESEEVEEKLRALPMQQAGTVFDSDFTYQYGHAEVKVVSTVSVDAKADKSNGGAIVIAVVLTGIAIGIGVFLYIQFRHHNRKRRNENYEEFSPI